LFSYLSPEARVPAKHPLRQVRELVRAVLKDLSPSFGKLNSSAGRPSIPPEQLLSALLLQVFYGIRSERQLMEQLDDNLLDRWFAGLAPDDPVWDTTTFTKNRDRRQHGEVFQKFMTKLLNHPQVKPLLSDEHFSIPRVSHDNGLQKHPISGFDLWNEPEGRPATKIALALPIITSAHLSFVAGRLSGAPIVQRGLRPSLEKRLHAFPLHRLGLAR
jgi:transposase